VLQRVDDHHPFAGARPDPHGDLGAGRKPSPGEHLGHERVRHEAGRYGDQVVAVAPPQGEVPAVVGGATERRPVSGGPEHRASGDPRVGDATLAPQRIGHHVDLQLPLGGRCHVLPAAPTAAGGHEGARRVGPAGGGLAHGDHLGPGMVAAQSTISASTSSPGRAPATSTTRPDGSRATPSPPAATAVTRSASTGPGTWSP